MTSGEGNRLFRHAYRTKKIHRNVDNNLEIFEECNQTGSTNTAIPKMNEHDKSVSISRALIFVKEIQPSNRLFRESSLGIKSSDASYGGKMEIDLHIIRSSMCDERNGMPLLRPNLAET
jgi:hypothetical protein